MSRIVLLHLSDSQVDTLTRVREANPDQALLVVHPQEDALVRRLARISEIPVMSTPPEPLGGDVVLRGQEAEDGDVSAWSAAGARILTPEDFLSGNGHRAADREAAPEAAPAVEPPAPPSNKPTVPEGSSPASFEMLASPEASLAFMAERVLGSPSGITLWWDGQVGLWTPWAGDLADRPRQAAPPRGLGIDTRWGAFVLAGPGSTTPGWDLEALRRVAEDMALRDLALFREQVNERPALKTPPTKETVGAWVEAAAPILQFHTALAWVGSDARWELVSAAGSGAVFSGSLKMEESLLDATLAHSSGWERSAWKDSGVRVYWRFPAEHQRWPVYLARLVRGDGLRG